MTGDELFDNQKYENDKSAFKIIKNVKKKLQGAPNTHHDAPQATTTRAATDSAGTSQSSHSTPSVKHHYTKIMDTEAPLSRRRVIRAFKMRGFSLQAPALEAMMNVLQRENSTQSTEVLQAILDEIRERRLQQPIVTEALLADVVADMSRDGRDVHEEALQLLDAFDTPRLDYDTMRKQFSLVDDQNRSFFGDANDKVRV